MIGLRLLFEVFGCVFLGDTILHLDWTFAFDHTP